MKTSNHAKDLFVRCLELDEEDIEEFLNEACGDDPEVRGDVERLLAKSKKVDSFFADNGEDATIPDQQFHPRHPSPTIEREGDRVGPYVLRQQIGEGGFGVVWMAEQTGELSRMVAVKVVKAGMDTREVLNRFEAERQALAMMDHPNIARVFDAGATESGRLYFAMELVKGIPITEFCDQQKFDPCRRLELFKDVCSAVNHAHQKGIIHRDLKPSNVMVTLHGDQPVVKIIDFGIAKATNSKLTEKTLFTRFEQFLGTPAYMSPEQAAMSGLDIDTRSDIYSLGVLLYELLAGAPPFDQKSLLSAGYDEMRRIIAEDEPPMPSNRLTAIRETSQSDVTGTSHVEPSALRGELDWIVMKAIDKDRSRRYGTANAFSADIERYLTDEPVEAAAPDTIYRLKKFARRNKAALAVAAVFLALLLGGIATTTWQAILATAGKQRAIAAEELAEERWRESEAARREAEAMTEFLTNVLNTVRPFTGDGGEGVGIADFAAKSLNEAGEISPERIAGLQGELAETYHIRRQYDKAIELREKVVSHYLETLGAENAETIRARINLSDSYEAARRHRDALVLRQDALESSREVHGPRDPVTLRVIEKLADSHEETGDPEKALELQKEVSLTHVIERVAPLAIDVGANELRIQMLESSFILEQAIKQMSPDAIPETSIEWVKEHLEVTIDPTSDEAIVAIEIDGVARKHLQQLAKNIGNAYWESMSGIQIHQERKARTKLLSAFPDEGAEKRWIAVNDSVMGGRSKGGPSFKENHLVFSGSTNTRFGGFSTIRNESQKHDLRDFSAIRARVKGDGRTYKMELRTNAQVVRGRTIPYRADFKTQNGKWIEIEIPFTDFEATFDGFSISRKVPILDPSNIEAFGFMIYDKQDGPFMLEVEWVKAVVI